MFFTCSVRSTSKCFRPSHLPSPPSQSLAQRTPIRVFVDVHDGFLLPSYSRFERAHLSRLLVKLGGNHLLHHTVPAAITTTLVRVLPPLHGQVPRRCPRARFVTESLRCRKALISDVSHQRRIERQHICDRCHRSGRWRSTRWIIGWQVLNQTSTHSALFCARQERPFAGCWRDSILGIEECIAADRSTSAGKNVVQLFNRNLRGPVVRFSNVFVECTQVLGCSVRLWWIFALTRCADNSGLGPSNLHALHIIV